MSYEEAKVTLLFLGKNSQELQSNVTLYCWVNVIVGVAVLESKVRFIIILQEFGVFNGHKPQGHSSGDHEE